MEIPQEENGDLGSDTDCCWMNMVKTTYIYIYIMYISTIQVSILYVYGTQKWPSLFLQTSYKCTKLCISRELKLGPPQ